MDIKIISVALGVVLGGLVSLISFHYKLRREIKGKVNEAIFHLLEVWSLIGMIKAAQSDAFFDKLVERIRAHLPYEEIDELVESQIKHGLKAAVPILIDSQTKTDGLYTDKYVSAVNDLAAIYPLEAFHLKKNKILLDFLEEFDNHVNRMEVTQADLKAIERIRNFYHDDSFSEFEAGLVRLSKKTSYSNRSGILNYIEKSKERALEIPNDVFDDYIECVILPMVQEHYDKLGIENPNVKEKA